MKSLRVRLGLAIAAAVLAAVAITLVVAAVLVDRSLNQGALHGLARQADLLSHSSTRPSTGRLGTFLSTQDERLAVLPRRQAELLLGAPAPAQGHVTVNGTPYLFAARPSGNQTVVVLRTQRSVSSDHRSYFIAFAAAAGVGALLAALIGSLVARGIAGRVGRVAAAARRLAAGARPEPLPEGGSTELQELSRSFNDMASQLAHARAAEQAFLLSVSHELKTPLTAIRGYAEALSDGVLSPARAADVMLVEAARLERLVTDLLELARLNRIGFDVECADVDLADVACETAERHAARAEEFGIALTWDASEDAYARADRDRLLQAVSNLVENAIRCTPAGGAVDVRASRGAIAVVDSGPGIAAEDQEHAFERFFLYRRYGDERPVGSGLGLAVVRELAHAMGGDVLLDSRPGAGATFTITLDAGAVPIRG
jgi:signal transduction histidine kinase